MKSLPSALAAITYHITQLIFSFPPPITYHPGKRSFASGLAGTSPHLSMELFKSIAKIDVVHISYKIGAQGITDTIGGQVPVSISNFPASVMPVNRDVCGRSRSLARIAPRSFPSVPTILEAGLPGYAVNSWYGVCAPPARHDVARQAAHRCQRGIARA